jgi:hypothetical protein
MKTKGTNHLIADVLAMSLEIRQHLEDRRRRLTPQQIDGLSNAVSALHKYVLAWRAHEMSGRNSADR